MSYDIQHCDQFTHKPLGVWQNWSLIHSVILYKIIAVFNELLILHTKKMEDIAP